MRALQYTEYGGPEVLNWEDAPTPHAGPGQIRISVRAASVNPIDRKQLTGALSGGQAMSDPAYLGFDAGRRGRRGGRGRHGAVSR
jgi:NADPH:quinone reductase-like Zn-dependent oxidoreductase